MVLVWLALGVSVASTSLPEGWLVKGCASLDEGACELGPEGRLVAFVPSGARLGVQGASVTRLEALPGGQRVELSPLGGATQLQLSAAGARFELELMGSRTPGLALAERCVLSRDLPCARAALAGTASAPADLAGARAALLAGWLELRSGRLEAAGAPLARARRWFEANRRPSEQSWAGLLELSAVVHGRRDHAAAGLLLEELPPFDERAADRLATAEYYRGLVELSLGQVRQAAAHLGRARQIAERIGEVRVRADAIQLSAAAHRRAGRFDEACRALAEIPADTVGLSPCEGVQRWINLGWTALLAEEAGGALACPDPQAPLNQALAQIEGGRCPAERSNVLSNLALAAVARGQWARGRSLLVRARAAGPDDGHEPWRRLAEARLDAGQGHLQRAKDGLRWVEAFSRAAGDRALAWRAELGLAQLAVRTGQGEEAHRWFLRAEAAAEREAELVRYGLGRSSAFVHYHAIAREHLAFLLDAGREEEALSVALASLTALFRSLSVAEHVEALRGPERRRWLELRGRYEGLQRELEQEAARDWTLSLEELARVELGREARRQRLEGTLEEALTMLAPKLSPGAWAPALPGELRLVYHPLPRGWAAFAVARERVQVARLPRIDPRAPPAELSRRLLGPFRAAIARAEVVKVTAFGALQRVDFHALPWEGAALATAREVYYSLGLPARPPPPVRLGRALLVADPRSDLAHAREEAEQLKDALHKSGLEVELLEGGAARAGALLAALDAAPELFHFAGHAETGRGDSWASGLLLAERAVLPVSELLQLERAPRVVVLAACSGASRSGLEGGVGLSIADVFVLGGAEAVLGAVESIPDREAREMGRAIELTPGAAAGPALHQVLRQVERRAPGVWRRLRVVVR